MALYLFNQENSHGDFTQDEYVIIEANSADEANEKALALGISWKHSNERENGVPCMILFVNNTIMHSG